MYDMFFENWQSLARAAISTVLAYITLIAMLRISGKRTLAKMNAFDFIVTVALGSTFATVALSKDVALADGAVVFALLIGMQFIITRLSVSYPAIKNLVTSQPTLLVYKGKPLERQMKTERIMLEDLYVAMRKESINSLEDVDAIVLETTGDIIVIQTVKPAEAETLSNIQNFPPAD